MNHDIYFLRALVKWAMGVERKLYKDQTERLKSKINKFRLHEGMFFVKLNCVFNLDLNESGSHIERNKPYRF